MIILRLYSVVCDRGREERRVGALLVPDSGANASAVGEPEARVAGGERAGSFLLVIERS